MQVVNILYASANKWLQVSYTPTDYLQWNEMTYAYIYKYVYHQKKS